MADINDRYTKTTYRIMEALLNIDDLDEALAESLQIIVSELHSQAGVIWYLDEKTDTLYPS